MRPKLAKVLGYGSAAVLATASLLTPLFAADMATKAPPPPSSDNSWTTIFDSDVRYFSWTSSASYPPILGIAAGTPGPGKGTLVYVPYALEVDGRPSPDLKLENLIRSGYISATQSSPAATGSFSSQTDTSISTKATYYGLNGIQPFASVAVNAPTGTSALFGNAANARMDPDIVDTPTFGEGWNVGTTLGVNVAPLKNLVFSFSGAYTYRGPYEREGILDPFTGMTATVRLDPGDDFVLTTNATYRNGDWKFQASAIYTIETPTSLNGASFYRSGDSFEVTGSVLRYWDDNWSSKLWGSFTHTNNNEIFVPGMPALERESFDSNSDITYVKFNTLYSRGAWSAGPTLGLLYRDHNEYDITDMFWLPVKTKYSAGGMASYDINKQLSFNARVERMWLREGAFPDNPLGVGTPPTITNAWMVHLGGSLVF